MPGHNQELPGLGGRQTFSTLGMSKSSCAPSLLNHGTTVHGYNYVYSNQKLITANSLFKGMLLLINTSRSNLENIVIISHVILINFFISLFNKFQPSSNGILKNTFNVKTWHCVKLLSRVQSSQLSELTRLEHLLSRN